jgi:uncharacterized membrane protein
MTVEPKGKAEVTVEYVLPKSISKDDYSLYIQKQGGIDQQDLEVKVDGKKKYDAKFELDQTIKM